MSDSRHKKTGTWLLGRVGQDHGEVAAGCGRVRLSMAQVWGDSRAMGGMRVCDVWGKLTMGM